MKKNERSLPVSPSKAIFIAIAIAGNLLVLDQPLDFDVFFTGVMLAFLVEDAFNARGPVTLVIAGYSFWNAGQRFLDTGVTATVLVFTVIGVGALLVSLRRFSQGTSPGTDRQSDAYVDLVVIRRVFNELQNGPRTTDELTNELDHAESRVEYAVDFLTTRNFVTLDGDSVRLSEGADSVFGHVRIRVSTVLSSLFGRNSA